MPITYEHREGHVLTPTQKTKFVTFVTGVWPGASGDIQSAVLEKIDLAAGYKLRFIVKGTLTVATAGELPPPPFNLDDDDGGYTYKHVEDVELSAGQESAFVDFVTDTWSGVPADVRRVSFSKAGSDIQAEFFGTMTVAAIGDLPDPPLRILSVT